MLKLYDLTTEYKREPLGLDEAQPRFGWKLDSDRQDTVHKIIFLSNSYFLL